MIEIYCVLELTWLVVAGAALICRRILKRAFCCSCLLLISLYSVNQVKRRLTWCRDPNWIHLLSAKPSTILDISSSRTVEMENQIAVRARDHWTSRLRWSLMCCTLYVIKQ